MWLVSMVNPRMSPVIPLIFLFDHIPITTETKKTINKKTNQVNPVIILAVPLIKLVNDIIINVITMAALNVFIFTLSEKNLPVPLFLGYEYNNGSNNIANRVLV